MLRYVNTLQQDLKFTNECSCNKNSLTTEFKKQTACVITTEIPTRHFAKISEFLVCNQKLIQTFQQIIVNCVIRDGSKLTDDPLKQE